MKGGPSNQFQLPIRLPAVAGSFYPADPAELRRIIDGFLQEAQPATVEGKLKILIVPHAGLEYSGRTAAAGFKQIEGGTYSKVIILGASHRVWFDYAAVFDKGQWETPLGKVDINEELAERIIDDNKIVVDLKPHKEEHSLEVELVFLQRVLKDFKIVPILLGQVSEDVLDSLAQKISQNFDENTLLVISSDLSHYPDWQTANKVDGETIRAIVSGNEKIFAETIKKLMSENYRGLETCACGEEAIRVALKVARKLSLTNIGKIRYENSGDLTGDKSRVVGYGAIGVWDTQKTAKSYLDEETKKEALQIVRKTLQEYLTNGKIPQIVPKSRVLQEPLGAFVTLRKNHELRGCIGRFEPNESLFKVIQEMAIAAAADDPRFSPVTRDELKEVTIEISVMTPKRKINDWSEIVLGKHGVVIQQGARSGTFLPQVATETGWSKEEFLSQLCSQKAGLPANCYLDPEVNLYVFEAQVFEEE